ncbi:MAG: hypothetical protein EBT15_10810 [Betaproteobacteria bacterium]|nr:hypothetical protein [Betaproteobacteria bacterium]
MDDKQLTTPLGFRTAAYLAARERLDLKGNGPKCKPPNRVCGDRCIPPNWKCRVKGEGTDSHSRVVAGDPLAGAASIARGRARLAKGLASGNIVDIQAGRAAIARGVVKAVPGQNLKEKQELRKNVEGALLPIAGGLFAVWLLRQAHEGAKVIFPVYNKGPAQDIENAASNAVGFVLDRIPVYGGYRQAQRRNADLQAQLIGRVTKINVNKDPSVFENNKNVFPNVARGKVEGLRAIMNESLDATGDDNKVKGYTDFRSNLLGGVLGAQKDGRSIYAEPAAINFLQKQFGIDKDKITSSKGIPEKSFVIREVRSRLERARSSMRSDMEVRGLDYRKPDDVEKYIKIAEISAAKRWGGMPEGSKKEAASAFRGSIRELMSPTSQTPGLGPSTMARRLYNEAENSYNNYFKEAATRVSTDTDPRKQVGAPATAAGAHVSAALIGVAERVKGRVRITGPIVGANHAELVLRKLYYEYSLKGKKFDPRSKTTWTASDADIKYAAQDLSWDGTGGVQGAAEHLRRNGFPNLAYTPAERPKPTPAPKPPTGNPPRAARRRTYSLEQRIAIYVKAGYSPETAKAKAEADIARLKNDSIDELPPRIQSYLLLSHRWS